MPSEVSSRPRRTGLRFWWWALAWSVLLHVLTVLGPDVLWPMLLLQLQGRPHDAAEVLSQSLRGKVKKVQLQQRSLARTWPELKQGFQVLAYAPFSPASHPALPPQALPPQATPARPKPPTPKPLRPPRPAKASRPAPPPPAVLATRSEAVAPLLPEAARLPADGFSPSPLPSPPEQPTPPPASATTELGRGATPHPSPSTKVAKFNDDGSFPERGQVVYYATFRGWVVELKGRWRVDASGYQFQTVGEALGRKIRGISEGAAGELGFQPASFSVYRDQNPMPTEATRFDWKARKIYFGKTSEPFQEQAIEHDAQDLFSFPFQLALRLDGEHDIPMQISTGRRVYKLNFHLLAEERLTTSVGKLRVAHLRADVDSSQQVPWEVWLALDYKNFPVKVRGPDNKGNLFEQELRRLVFVQKTVLPEAVAEDEPEEVANVKVGPDGRRP